MVNTKVSSNSAKLMEVLQYLANLNVPLNAKNVTTANMLGNTVVGVLQFVYGVDLYSNNVLNQNMQDNRYIFNILQSLSILGNITLNIESQVAELNKLKSSARLALDLERLKRRIDIKSYNINDVSNEKQLKLKKDELNELKCKQRHIGTSIKKLEKALSSKAGVFEQMDVNDLLAKIQKFQTQLESSKTTADMKEQIHAKIAKSQKKLAIKQQELDEVLALKQQSNLEQLESLKQENHILGKRIAHLEKEIKVLDKQISVLY